MLCIEHMDAALARKGATKSDLAKAMKSSYTAILHWRKGRNDISASKLVLMARYLNVSTDYLLGLTDTPDANYSK